MTVVTYSKALGVYVHKGVDIDGSFMAIVSHFKALKVSQIVALGLRSMHVLRKVVTFYIKKGA